MVFSVARLNSDPASETAHALDGAALAYAARGWSVVPMYGPGRGGCSCRRANCPSPGKHPRISWTVATEQAAGPDQVETWWRRWPDANVAIATGTVSGIVVLDIDPRYTP